MAFFQKAPAHTYLKRESDKFWFGGVLFVGMAGGGLLALKGYSDMIRGTGKKAV
jgi:hypothetical protein